MVLVLFLEEAGPLQVHYLAGQLLSALSWLHADTILVRIGVGTLDDSMLGGPGRPASILSSAFC